MIARVLLCLALLFAAPASAQQVTFGQRAVVSASSSGDNIVIAGVTGKRISVWALDLVLASSTTVTLKDASTALTGAMTLTQYTKPLVAGVPAYWTLGVGDNFVVNLGTGVQVSGVVWYSVQ